MSASEASAARPAHAWIVVPGGAAATRPDAVRVFHLTSLERLERALRRAGVEAIHRIDASDAMPDAAGARCPLFRSDYFYDERLIAGLLDAEQVVLAGEDGGAIAANVDPGCFAATLGELRGERDPQQDPPAEALRRVGPLELAPAYNAALRKFDPPFVYRAAAADAQETENRIFASSYKGITDLVTKWVFPVPARSVVRVLARRGVAPNTVTAVSYVLTILAAWLFYEGRFGVGLVCAWLMTFLDTVDGKLARVTLTSSPIGNVLDHGLDLVHPPIWWAAWAFGLAPGAAGYEIAMWIVVGGYVTGRLLEGVFLLAFKMEIFTWRPFDAFFRTIIARRNPNLLMLTAGVIAGRPGVGFLAVAFWTVACHVVPMVRIGQAFAERRRGGVIRPWHEEQAVAQGATLSLLVAQGAMLSLLVALATPTAAIEPPPELEPGARLPSGDDASEYWDITAQLDSGHRVFARFMITNIGPGDRNAIATGHVLRPDGSAVPLQNGRRAARWKLSPDRLHLDVGSSELDLHAPTYRLDIHKDDVQIDLHFTPAGAPQLPPGALPSGYAIELLDAAAPATGSLKLPEMSEPLAVSGRVALVHSWLERSEAKLATRRIEFFSLQKDRIYVLELKRADGKTTRWFSTGSPPGSSAGGSELDILNVGNLHHTNDRYRAPGALELEGEWIKGQVQLGRNILSHDSLAEIPQPFRFFVAMNMQPWRVWAESTFDVTLRADRESSPSHHNGYGITVVTFSSPTEKP